MKQLAVLLLLVALPLLPSCKRPIPSAPDREVIAGAVVAFHDALKKGDRAAALALLAEDAQVLESGKHETRAEYERNHLAADVAFAKAVPSERTAMIVRQDGMIAWTSSTGKSAGEFNGRPIKSTTTELMVLSKTDNGWRIRAIHWSGH